MRALQLIEDRKLEIVDIAPPPPPALGEVTVRIKAVALNHIDVWGWRGMAFAKRKMPLIDRRGSLGRGRGDRPRRRQPCCPASSSRSTARAPAAFAAPAAKAATIFASMSPACTASISTALPRRRSTCRRACWSLPLPASTRVGAAVAPVTFGTVEHMLFDNAKLEPGETILVHAGGSGIGSAAIQLAKKMGCTVITTVGSDDKIEKAKALGADHVINYREDRFEGVVRKLTKKKGVDVVFEHVGADTWAGSMLSLKRGGRLVTCGSTSGVSTQMNLMQLFQQQLKLLGSFGCRMENMADAMQKMAARPRQSGDRHRSRLRRYRRGAEAHGRPRRVRQDHPARQTETHGRWLKPQKSAGLGVPLRQAAATVQLLADRAARACHACWLLRLLPADKRAQFRRPRRPPASARGSAAIASRSTICARPIPKRAKRRSRPSPSTCGATWRGWPPNMSFSTRCSITIRDATKPGRIEVQGVEHLRRRSPASDTTAHPLHRPSRQFRAAAGCAAPPSA